MMKRVLMFGLGVMFAAAAPASAELVFSTAVSTTGNGLGAVNTLVTVHDPGGPGNNNLTESGCINQDGSYTPCLLGLEGGDNVALNSTYTLSNNTSFAAVVNVSEIGTDLSATLTDLYLTFCGTNGCHTAQYTGVDLALKTLEGTGIGGAGFVFILDAAQAGTVAVLGPTVKVSGGVQFKNGTTGDGNETLSVATYNSSTAVPDGGTTVLLLGCALFGLGALRRKIGV